MFASSRWVCSITFVVPVYASPSSFWTCTFGRRRPTEWHLGLEECSYIYCRVFWECGGRSTSTRPVGKWMQFYLACIMDAKLGLPSACICIGEWEVCRWWGFFHFVNSFLGEGMRYPEEKWRDLPRFSEIYQDLQRCTEISLNDMQRCERDIW